MKLHASPLWDADGNLHIKLFEYGKGSTPLCIYTDDEFHQLLDRLHDMFRISKKLDAERRAVFDPLSWAGPELHTLKMPRVVTDDERTVISHWYVLEGADVAAGDPLFEIETDKATNLISAPKSLRLIKQLVRVGDTVKTDDAVCFYTGYR